MSTSLTLDHKSILNSIQTVKIRYSKFNSCALNHFSFRSLFSGNLVCDYKLINFLLIAWHFYVWKNENFSFMLYDKERNLSFFLLLLSARFAYFSFSTFIRKPLFNSVWEEIWGKYYKLFKTNFSFGYFYMLNFYKQSVKKRDNLLVQLFNGSNFNSNYT